MKKSRTTVPAHERRGARRLAEWAVIEDQLRRNREAFIARLQRLVRVDGDCRTWTGAPDANGYARLCFYVPGQRRRGRQPRKFFIGVHRLFLMLALKRPINEGMEAGHYECHNRLCVKHVIEQTKQENLQHRDARRKEKETECEV